MKRLIREEEPPRPSTRLSSDKTLPSLAASRQVDAAKLPGLVRGELDWIVMKALDKDRSRRYDTANGLAKDVQRYLAGDSVEACPPTLGYRLRKAYRRNRAGVLVGGTIACVLLVATGVSLVFGMVARNAERLAEQERLVADRERDAALLAGEQARQRGDEVSAALAQLGLARKREAADQYIWDMQLLPYVLEKEGAPRAESILSRHIPKQNQLNQTDPRGFEWHYWNRYLHSHVSTTQLQGLDDSRSVPAERWLPSEDGNRLVQVIHPTPPGSISPESNPALGDNKEEQVSEITVWDLPTGRVVHKFRIPIPASEQAGETMTVAFGPEVSPDGKWLALIWRWYDPDERGRPPLPGRSPLRGQEEPVQTVLQVVDIERKQVAFTFEGMYPRGSDSIVVRSAFSPDNRRIALRIDRSPNGGSDIPPVGRVWDLATGRELPRPPEGTWLALKPFNQDGTRVLLTSVHADRRGSRRIVWDVDAGKELVSWDLPTSLVPSTSFSPDGSKVLSVVGNSEGPIQMSDERNWSLKVWEASTGKELRSIRLPLNSSHSVSSHYPLQISTDGARLLCTRRMKSSREDAFGQFQLEIDVCLIDLLSGNLIRHDSDDSMSAFYGSKLSPDGKWLILRYRDHMQTWDAATRSPGRKLYGKMGMLGFSQNGERVRAVHGSGMVTEWNLEPPMTVVDLGEGRRAISNIEHGERFASVSGNDHGRIIRIHDHTGNITGSIEIPRSKPTLNFDRGHRAFVFAGGRVLYAERLGPFRRDVAARRLNSGDPHLDSVRVVYDVATGKILHDESFSQTNKGSEFPETLSPYGRLLVFGVASQDTNNPAIRVYDLNKQRDIATIAVPKTDDEVSILGELSVSPDGRWLAATIRRQPKPVVPRDRSQIIQITRQLMVWDIRSGRPALSSAIELGPDSFSSIGTFLFRSGRAGRFPRTAWSPDGTRLAFIRGQGDESRIAIIDVATGRPCLSPEHEPRLKYSLDMSMQRPVFSPDGRRIAVAARDVEILHVTLWDTETGKEMLDLPVSWKWYNTTDLSLAFTPDGHQLRLFGMNNPSQLIKSGSSYVQITTIDATPPPELGK